MSKPPPASPASDGPPEPAPIADRFQMGLIAGGMDDGTINICDASSISGGGGSDKSSYAKAMGLLSKIARQSGAITALAFNSHPSSSTLFASDGRYGEISSHPSMIRPNPP